MPSGDKVVEEGTFVSVIDENGEGGDGNNISRKGTMGAVDVDDWWMECLLDYWCCYYYVVISPVGYAKYSPLVLMCQSSCFDVFSVLYVMYKYLKSMDNSLHSHGTETCGIFPVISRRADGVRVD